MAFIEKKNIEKKKKFRRRKVCKFCADPEVYLGFKDAQGLSFFISDKGKIVSRRVSGTCAKHQRDLSRAIKRARNLSLLPFNVLNP